MRPTTGLAAIALLAACGTSVPEPMPTTSDAGPIEDAGVADAGPIEDAGVVDSSDSFDAGGVDAPSSVDAGSALSALCRGAATAPFQPPTVCDALSGNTTTTRPSNAVYSTSWFGCYYNAAGALVTDPGDNCEFACGSRGLCPSGVSGPQCEAQLKWFSADADRFGCGARIQVTNCANGRSVVLAALDKGPNCRTVEKAYGAPVLDMSRPAMQYLFDGRTYGGADKKRVVVEVVSQTAALGPVP